MSDYPLPQNTILVGEQEYTTALDTVIAEAQQQLLIFDQDCATGGFASIKRFELIQTFLTKTPTTKLIIILQNTDFFTDNCPRLFHLLTLFDHKMTVYQTNYHARTAKDCFILADNHAYIQRFHIDQARFKYALDDPDTTASLANRFDELLQETSHTLSATKLGL